jgi:hypothetical protein
MTFHDVTQQEIVMAFDDVTQQEIVYRAVKGACPHASNTKNLQSVYLSI